MGVYGTYKEKKTKLLMNHFPFTNSNEQFLETCIKKANKYNTNNNSTLQNKK